MAVAAVTLTEFYRQLGLLLQARLPLPDSLRQLADDLNEPSLRATVQQLGEDTASGQPLAAAMARQPGRFTPAQVRLVALGEGRGVLPEVLDVLARSAWDEQQFTRQARDTFLYPALTVYAAITLILLLLRYLVPGLGAIMQEDILGKHEPLPWISAAVMTLSAGVRTAWPALVVLWVAGLLAGGWLFSQAPAAGRVLYAGCGRLPLGWRVLQEWEHARLCRLLSILLRFEVPMADALELCAGVAAGARLARDLQAWAMAVRAGTSLAAALVDAGRSAGLLRLALRTPDEGRLADCLADLSEVHQEAAAAASQTFYQAAAVAAMIVMMLISTLALLAFFLPLLHGVESFEGCDC